MKRIPHVPLFRFMNARHEIYLLRQQGAKAPWTKDHVLQTCFFTNVYRELDKVTVWVRENIRKPYARDPNLPFYLCVARHFNLPSTLELLIEGGAMTFRRAASPWDGKKAKALLKRARKNGAVYTGAYLVSTAGLSMDKVDYSIDKVLDPMMAIDRSHGWAKAATLQHAHENLSHYYGWAGFMAYEVICDLRYTSWLRNAKDVRTWANPGPGAKRGINRLLGNGGTTRGLPTVRYVEYMQQLLSSIEQVWPHEPKLELREIEHSLCEFDKYERVRLGQGRSKRMYNATGE